MSSPDPKKRRLDPESSAVETRETSESILSSSGKQPSTVPRCPYLDTINRKLLDFDFEKLCSVSLSHHNVYGCLVCGKFFQGRGSKSPAHTHSVQVDHHVFVNLQSGTIYCLPDDYIVDDPSLNDIKFNLSPKFNEEDLKMMDSSSILSTALDGTRFLPGFIGLNNVSESDWLNVILQAIMRCHPVRDYFIFQENYAHCNSQTIHRFGEFVRKFWNPSNYKPHVSPHELIQAISSASSGRFKIGEKSDPVLFLSYFLNTLDRDLMKKSGVHKARSSVISKNFKGEVEISEVRENVDVVENVSTKGFMFLSLQLPPIPLFRDSHMDEIIPQVSIFNLLSKFDGQPHDVSYCLYLLADSYV